MKPTKTVPSASGSTFRLDLLSLRPELSSAQDLLPQTPPGSARSLMVLIETALALIDDLDDGAFGSNDPHGSIRNKTKDGRESK